MRNMLKPHEPNLLSVFKNEGYEVWWGGKNDLVRAESEADFLDYCHIKHDDAGADYTGPAYQVPEPLSSGELREEIYYQGVLKKASSGVQPLRGDPAHVRGAREWIQNRSDDRPFFCYLPLTTPHPGYLVEEEFLKRIDPSRIPPRIQGTGEHLPEILSSLRMAYGADAVEESLWRDLRHVYYAMCAKVDDWLGEVLQALRDRGCYENTWVVFLSDHGDFTGDYSLVEKTHHTLQDALVRVPLVIKPPKDVPREKGIRDGLVELIDLPATLYDMLNIDPGYNCQGTSLGSALSLPTASLRSAVFAEVGRRRDEVGFFNPSRDGKPHAGFYGVQCATEHPFHEKGSYAVMCRTERFKAVRRPYTGHHEFYDLHSDPDELINLSERPEWNQQERELGDRLLDFFLRTADVLPHELDPRLDPR